jgi:hypothetical protein
MISIWISGSEQKICPSPEFGVLTIPTPGCQQKASNTNEGGRISDLSERDILKQPSPSDFDLSSFILDCLWDFMMIVFPRGLWWKARQIGKWRIKASNSSEDVAENLGMRDVAEAHFEDSVSYSSCGGDRETETQSNRPLFLTAYGCLSIHGS